MDTSFVSLESACLAPSPEPNPSRLYVITSCIMHCIVGHIIEHKHYWRSGGYLR